MHWSSRLLAKHLKISFSAAVAKALWKCGIQPWRAEIFKFSSAADRQPRHLSRDKINALAMLTATYLDGDRFGT
jgi:hypothetical protein